MSDLQLTPEERRVFDKFYQKRVDEARAGGSDIEELEVAQDILTAVVNDGLTPAADGSVSYVRRGAADWTDERMVSAAMDDRSSGSPIKSKGKNEMLQGILLMVVALIAGGYFLLPGGDSAPEEAEAIVTLEATEEAVDISATITPIPTLEAELLADIVDGGVKTELVVPRTLEIEGVSFVVQPIKIEAGDWLPPDEERVVSWVYGTVINYIMGVESTEANKNLLASLEAGDELLLRMSTGSVYRFAYADVVRVAPQASEIFRQNRPGLTLVLLSDAESETRIVIRANFIPESEFGLAEQLPEIQVGLGEAVMLDNSVRVMCIGGGVLPSTDAPPGYIYQAVEYQVENLGDLPLAARDFKHHIEAAGMTYPIVQVPHETNPFPELPEILEAGQVISTTAIYAVPESIVAAEALAWEFSPGPSGMKARVLLPSYQQMGPTVVVKTADISEQELVVTFVIEADLRDVELTAGDIQVDGGVLNPAANSFPWQVQAGEGGEFVLSLEPSGTGITTVAFLQQGFELTY